MGYSNFTIRTKAIKNPSGFKMERYKVTTMTRLANAKMVGDEVARKRKFYFTYASIQASDLDNILDLIYEQAGLFFTLTYKYNGLDKSAVVYAGAIPQDLHNAAVSNWVWKGVSFDLIEQ